MIEHEGEGELKAFFSMQKCRGRRTEHFEAEKESLMLGTRTSKELFNQRDLLTKIINN